MSDDVNQKLIEGWKKAFGANGLPALEVPAAFREIAQKGLSTYRQSYGQAQAAMEQANATLAQSYGPAGKGLAECQKKAMEALNANVASTFDYYEALLGAKTMAEIVELSSAHVRRQYENVAAQTKTLTGLAQSAAAEGTSAFKNGL